MHTEKTTTPPLQSRQSASPLPPGTALRHAETDAELRACWPAMQQLRPHLASAEDFVTRVRHMHADGYRLLAVWRDGQALALGGYRLQYNLIYGPFLYVDDLVTLDGARSQGWGAHLIAALRGIAAQEGCAHFVLDTHVANTSAQRFYVRQGLANHAIRFSAPVVSKAGV